MHVAIWNEPEQLIHYKAHTEQFWITQTIWNNKQPPSQQSKVIVHFIINCYFSLINEELH